MMTIEITNDIGIVNTYKIKPESYREIIVEFRNVLDWLMSFTSANNRTRVIVRDIRGNLFVQYN